MDEFVSLADLLRPRARDDAPAPDGAGNEPQAAAAESAATASAEDASDDAGLAGDEADVHAVVTDALREAKLFRARLADAFDDARGRLLRELASDVLARELRIAPCDLDVLAQRALASAPVVRVRVAPSEIGLVSGIPVVADPELAEGDAVVEIDGGAIDARLGARLALILEAFE